MNRILRILGVLFLLLLWADLARAETVVSCAAVTVAGACDWVPTAGYQKIVMSLFAVNVSTGATDTTATSASQAVLEFKECESCPPIQFPKAGDAPITNVGGGCAPTDGACSTPARAWRLPPKTYAVRWVMRVMDSGRVTGIVTRDTE